VSQREDYGYHKSNLPEPAYLEPGQSDNTLIEITGAVTVKTRFGFFGGYGGLLKKPLIQSSSSPEKAYPEKRSCGVDRDF
jgi:hypothetical protein